MTVIILWRLKLSILNQDTFNSISIFFQWFQSRDFKTVYNVFDLSLSLPHDPGPWTCRIDIIPLSKHYLQKWLLSVLLHIGNCYTSQETYGDCYQIIGRGDDYVVYILIFDLILNWMKFFRLFFFLSVTACYVKRGSSTPFTTITR